jgi:hypothetical protein
MRPRWLGVFLIGWMLVGVVVLALGAKALVDSQRFLAKAVVANGIVVDVARVVNSDNEVSFYPVVEFVTAREQVVRFQADEATPDPEQRMGDSVRILHDPADPGNARLDTGFSRWGAGAVLGFVGLGFVVSGAGAYLLLRRGQP